LPFKIFETSEILFRYPIQKILKGEKMKNKMIANDKEVKVKITGQPVNIKGINFEGKQNEIINNSGVSQDLQNLYQQFKKVLPETIATIKNVLITYSIHSMSGKVTLDVTFQTGASIFFGFKSDTPNKIDDVEIDKEKHIFAVVPKPVLQIDNTGNIEELLPISHKKTGENLPYETKINLKQNEKPSTPIIKVWNGSL
jgi:hypothetical protein